MKLNSTQSKLARKVTLKIVFVLSWCVIFPIVVVVGIYTKLTEPKVNAKTRITSVESKIHPKNTKDRDTFGYPDRSVK
jgi:hypothetical protein